VDLTFLAHLTKGNVSFLSFDSFGQAVSEGEEFLEKEPIRKKNCLWLPCLLTDIINTLSVCKLSHQCHIQVTWLPLVFIINTPYIQTNRRTDNTMAIRIKDKRANNNLQNTTEKTND
jgi:hypothetical protein